MTARSLLVFFIVLAAVFLLRGCNHARAHEHQKGELPEQARVIEFYRTWHRPKGSYSIKHREPLCCFAEGKNQDCFPVLGFRKDDSGVIEVKPNTDGASTDTQLEFGDWYKLNTGVEEDKQIDPRESPDGRSHVCIVGQAIVCYVAGSGQ